MEDVKIQKFGADGQNRAEVVEESQDPTTERARHGASLMTEAGKLYCPIQADYLGSATIHYYKHETLPSHPQFFVACQLNISGVEEHHADLGWKQLRSALMKAYGREEPKTNAIV